MKDYCSFFPESWVGIDITECCKEHDNNCDTSRFYNCLANKIGKFHATYIAFGGSIGCWLKYTRHMITKKDT